MLLQVPESLPKIKTNRYYKYYKNQDAFFDVFYNKDVSILESTSSTVFAYENTIVFSNQDYLVDKVLRDLVVAYGIKLHDVNKENANQYKINNIVEGLKKINKRTRRRIRRFRLQFPNFHSVLCAIISR